MYTQLSKKLFVEYSLHNWFKVNRTGTVPLNMWRKKVKKEKETTDQHTN